MKKMFAIVLALMLCVSALSVVAFAAEGDVTIHAEVPEGWGAPNAYTWEPEDLGSWPGSAMTENDGCWEATMPGTHTTLIINDGTNQTVDLTIEAGKDVWVVVSETAGDEGKFTATISYEDPNGGTDAPETDAPETDAPETDAPETDAPETETPETENPKTGDMSIAAVSVALLTAAAGLVATVSKKKEN